MTSGEAQDLISHLIKSSAFEMSGKDESFHEFVLKVSYALMARGEYSQDLSQETLTQITALMAGIMNIGIFVGKTNFYEEGYDEFKKSMEPV